MGGWKFRFGSVLGGCCLPHTTYREGVARFVKAVVGPEALESPNSCAVCRVVGKGMERQERSRVQRVYQISSLP
jgi:hypothetical protein